MLLRKILITSYIYPHSAIYNYQRYYKQLYITQQQRRYPTMNRSSKLAPLLNLVLISRLCGVACDKMAWLPGE